MFKYQRLDRRHSAPRKSTRAVRPRLEALESRLVLSTITGTVFNDLHVTGVLAANDPGIAGRTVFEDLNGTGVQAPGDPTAVTGSAGHYTLTGATSGFNLRFGDLSRRQPDHPDRGTGHRSHDYGEFRTPTPEFRLPDCTAVRPICWRRR